jgi:hypothetical protein
MVFTCLEVSVKGMLSIEYNLSLIDAAVERLYCKRPNQCLASSKILTPHPLNARRV